LEAASLRGWLGRRDNQRTGEGTLFQAGNHKTGVEGAIMFDWNRWYQYQKAMTLWQWGLVIVAFSLAAWIIVWLKSCFREDADDADQTLEMLTQFRDLHQEGGLSDDEFRLIRSRLARSAQEALVAGQKKTKVVSIEVGLPDLMEAQHDPSSQSPAIHATAENEAKSERMTDEETD
jgi:hypothetical protein